MGRLGNAIPPGPTFVLGTITGNGTLLHIDRNFGAMVSYVPSAERRVKGVRGQGWRCGVALLFCSWEYLGRLFRAGGHGCRHP